MCVTKSEYEELGSARCRKKFFHWVLIMLKVSFILTDIEMCAILLRNTINESWFATQILHTQLVVIFLPVLWQSNGIKQNAAGAKLSSYLCWFTLVIGLQWPDHYVDQLGMVKCAISGLLDAHTWSVGLLVTNFHPADSNWWQIYGTNKPLIFTSRVYHGNKCAQLLVRVLKPTRCYRYIGVPSDVDPR